MLANRLLLRLLEAMILPLLLRSFAKISRLGPYGAGLMVKLSSPAPAWNENTSMSEVCVIIPEPVKVVVPDKAVAAEMVFP